MGIGGLNLLKDRADDYCSCPPGSVDEDCPTHKEMINGE